MHMERRAVSKEPSTISFIFTLQRTSLEDLTTTRHGICVMSSLPNLCKWTSFPINHMRKDFRSVEKNTMEENDIKRYEYYFGGHLHSATVFSKQSLNQCTKWRQICGIFRIKLSRIEENWTFYGNIRKIFAGIIFTDFANFGQKLGKLFSWVLRRITY